MMGGFSLCRFSRYFLVKHSTGRCLSIVTVLLVVGGWSMRMLSSGDIEWRGWLIVVLVKSVESNVMVFTVCGILGTTVILEMEGVVLLGGVLIGEISRLFVICLRITVTLGVSNSTSMSLSTSSAVGFHGKGGMHLGRSEIISCTLVQEGLSTL